MEAHMARTREQIVAQILKLTEVANRSLESTDDDSGVAHEDVADNATKKIAKLMRRHQIEMADIEAAQETKDQKFVRFEFSVSNSYGLGKERSSALHWAVITPFGANSMRTVYKSARTDVKMTVFAPASIAEMLKALMYSISLQMEMGLKEASREERARLDKIYYLSQSQSNGEVLRFRRGYIRAFGTTVGSRVGAAQQEAMEEAKRELEAEGLTLNSSTELVLANSSEQAKIFMDAWYFETSGGAKLRTSTSRAKASSLGRDAGNRDGRKADIQPPRANAGQRALVG
jgi:hypothetical protein